MSRDVTLHQTLESLVRVLDQSESLASEQAMFTDPAALRQARLLAPKAIDVLHNGDGTQPSESRSSVEMTQNAKGEIRISVKAYSGSPIEPAEGQAWSAFQRLMAQAADAARVTEAEAANGHA